MATARSDAAIGMRSGVGWSIVFGWLGVFLL
jgi:hypothetical protein